MIRRILSCKIRRHPHPSHQWIGIVIDPSKQRISTPQASQQASVRHQQPAQQQPVVSGSSRQQSLEHQRQPKEQQPAGQQSLQQTPRPQELQEPSSLPPVPPKQPQDPIPAEEPKPKGFIQQLTGLFQQIPQQLPSLYQKKDTNANIARSESHSTWWNPDETEVVCQDSISCRGSKGGSRIFMEEEEPSASDRYMAKKKGVPVSTIVAARHKPAQEPSLPRSTSERATGVRPEPAPATTETAHTRNSLVPVAQVLSLDHERWVQDVMTLAWAIRVMRITTFASRRPSQREEGRDPAVAWIWPQDNTEYSDERPFVGSPDEADALDTLGVDEAPLTTHSHTVTWGEFGLDTNSDGSNLRRDRRSQGNNRRPRQPVQRTLSPTPEPRTPERVPVRALPAAPRRDRHARPAPYPRQPSPLLRQARPPARRDPFSEDPEPPAPRRRFRIPSPLTPPPPLPPRQPADIIDLVGEDDEAIDHVEEEGVVDPVVEEEEEVAAGEVDGMADQDPAITNGFLEPGPSQPPVETRDSLIQRLEELRARRDPLMEELDSITQEISDVQAQLEGWDN
ncbi:uncharacterized protein NECHADRAFT_88837 [Fusarium vanettenii 77-13-4]|uniref:Uncharacterized protein n=1 Tax=Fusarium vanettenii (strain ATCC MYA-4622 / CBS 123669 / FGSC 9596 / NRRL 45880 / 77-13-4) TaxID=660122 RepID=C7ZN57_FUSV7|nr:uncharacterized protein NECHADRAFT_88837 [Fusarium vanettenii 77-13-4]EEU34540.1 predicted protein [Fusarium vanettenii 77-13-4]